MAGNLVIVVKFTFQGVTRAVFYPLIRLANIKTKGFTSQKSFCRYRSQTFLFGWREVKTGNTFVFAGYSAVNSPGKSGRLQILDCVSRSPDLRMKSPG